MPKENIVPILTIRLRSKAQRELIRRAARQADCSMNSFVRSAAEKEARQLLKAPPVEVVPFAQS